MASKLAIVNSYDRRGWALAWVDEDGEGSHVGEWAPKAPLITRDDYESAAVFYAAKPFADYHRNGQDFVFSSSRTAREALRAAKLALKNVDVPMPEWAKQAAAAGWRPPKGWKP